MPTGSLTVAGREIIIRRVQLEEIIALRHAELRPGLPRHTAEFEGDAEPTAFHLGAFVSGPRETVGCASFVARPWRKEAAYQLRGMATRGDLVRRGIGRALLAFAEGLIPLETGIGLLWCNARMPAVPFYRKLGWTVVGERFEIPTVGPHYAMVRRLR